VIEILKYFLRLGFTGFGGPVALSGMMQEELVIKRKWIDADEFKQAFVLIKAMPGPLAFQTATYLSYRRGGFWGALIGGLSLVLPASLMVLIVAIALPGLKTNSSINAFLIGSQIAALWVMGFTLVPLVKPQAKNTKFWILFFIGLFPLWFYPAFEPFLIFSFGLVMILWNKQFNKRQFNKKLYAISVVGASLTAVVSSVPNMKELVLVSLKAGSLIFGTGIAIIPVLESDFVQRLHWISHEEFMNALAIGQITPGPILVTITYIGYKALGLMGAFGATTAVFLPSFFHMTTWFPRAQTKLSKQVWINNFCNGALACVGASIVTSLLRLLLGFQWNIFLVMTLIVCIFVHLKWKLPSWVVIPSMGLFYLVCSKYLEHFVPN
jgi:chromate transporter